MSGADPYDAILLVSFGGPERAEDVLPFLENVTRGRGIPRERLAEVGQHYYGFGGRSPINDQCRSLLARAANRTRSARHRPTAVLGKSQLGSVSERDRSPRSRPTGTAAWWRSPRVPTPRTLRVGSTGRTCTTPCRARRYGWTRSGTTPTIPASWPHRSGPRWRPSTNSATRVAAAGWSSSPMPFRPRWPTSSGPPPRSAEGGYVDWHRVVAAEVTRQVAAQRDVDQQWDLVVLLAIRSADAAVDRTGRERSPGGAECGGSCPASC